MKTEPTPTLAAVAPATPCSACSEIPVSGTTETQARQIKGNSYRVYHGGEGSPFTDHKDLVMARASACGYPNAVIHHLRPFRQPNTTEQATRYQRAPGSAGSANDGGDK